MQGLVRREHGGVVLARHPVSAGDVRWQGSSTATPASQAQQHSVLASVRPWQRRQAAADLQCMGWCVLARASHGIHPVPAQKQTHRMGWYVGCGRPSPPVNSTSPVEL